MINDKDANRSLSEKVGLTPEKKKPAAAKPKVKKEKSSPSGDKKSPKKAAKKNKKNPWESSDDDGSMDSDSDAGGDLSDVAPIARDNVRRNKATTKYKIDTSDSEDADDLFNEIKTTNGSSNGAAKNGNGKHDSSDSKMDDEFDSLMDHSNASSVIIIF